MAEFPHGPVFRSDSSGERPFYQDTEQKYLSGVRNWREQAREEAFNTARLSPEINAISRYAKSLMGQFWDRRRPRYKSSYFDNRMDNARLSDLALLTDTRPTIAVGSGTPAFQQQAEMCQRVIQDEWTRRNMDLDLVRAVDITQLSGTGFWKIGAALPGQFQIVPCGMENVMPIQPGFDIQQSTAVLYRTWKSLAYFRNKFPFNCSDLDKESNFQEFGRGGAESRFNRPSEIPEFTWNGLSPGMKRALGVLDTHASDMASDSIFKNLELQEYTVDDPSVNDSPHPVLIRHPWLSLEQHNYWYWVKPGQRLYPRKRLLVFAGGRLMYDGPSPFWHGLYPFACMRLNPVPWSFWGLSKYRNLLPLNDGLNEIGAGIMDMIKRALNPACISKMGSVTPTAWKEFYPDLPGAKLQMQANTNIQTDLRYMDPPQIPQWVMVFHQYLSAEFDRLSGAIDVTALGKKKQVPGGDTIEQMRELQNSVIRLQGRYIEKFLEDSGKIAVSNFFQFWTLDTRMRRMGDAGISWDDLDEDLGTLIPDGMPKEQFWLRFSMKISAGSLLTNARDREKQTAMALGSKDMLPVKAVYRALELPDPEGLYQELIQQRQDGVQPGGRGSRTTRGQRNGKMA